MSCLEDSVPRHRTKYDLDIYVGHHRAVSAVGLVLKMIFESRG